MNKLVLWLIFVYLAIHSVAYSEILHWNDGLPHNIIDDTYLNDHIRLDYGVTNNPGTHLDLISGIVGQLDLHRNATITMTGGTVMGELEAVGQSTITMINGSVGGTLTAHGGSTVYMSGGMVGNYFQGRMNGTIIMTGGSVERGLEAINDSVITLSGGTVGTLGAAINGTIYLKGSGFAVNGYNLSYGDKLSNYVPLQEQIINGDIYEYYTGTITGTLNDGSSLNNIFAIYNKGLLVGTGDIIIIPEPTTLFFFAIGAVLVRKRR